MDLALAIADFCERETDEREPASKQFAGQDLSGQDFADRDLRGADFTGATLVGARLSGARLDDATFLGANLQACDLTEVRGSGANFGGADLTGAVLFGAELPDALFTSARLVDLDARSARLRGARLGDVDLEGALFDAADVRDASLREANVAGASFRGTDFRGARLSHLRDFESADWIDANLTDVDFRGAYDVRRYAHDENYLYEFRTRNRANAAVYKLWKLTSDCGRNFTRWLVFTCAVAVLFAAVYSFVAIDFGPNETALSPLYFSVVTATTLGYGDALPTSGVAQVVVMLQVLIGYVLFGGLVSILAGKLARRA